jgi:hypothetical protein
MFVEAARIPRLEKKAHFLHRVENVANILMGLDVMRGILRFRETAAEPQRHALAPQGCQANVDRL